MASSIPKHLIKQSFEAYSHQMRGSAIDPSELDFICGFNACLGIITGTLDLGIPEDTSPTQLLQQLLEEIHYKYRPELKALEEVARIRTEKLRNMLQ